MIPTRKWVFDLISQREMPHNIICHSLMVQRVAVIIACALNEKGMDINIPLVDRAALLHDICKIDTIRSGGDHSRMAQYLLENLGYSHIGDIVGQHVRLKSLKLDETMVINYADKRVMHDKVVSLSRRFIDLMDRYGTDEMRCDRILASYNDAVHVESIIRDHLPFDPEWLNNLNLILGDNPFKGRDNFLRNDSLVKI